MVHSQITNILTFLQKMQDKYSVMSNQIDNMHISTSSISNSTSLSPTTIPEVTVDDAIATATAMVSRELISIFDKGNSRIGIISTLRLTQTSFPLGQILL